MLLERPVAGSGLCGPRVAAYPTEPRSLGQQRRLESEPRTGVQATAVRVQQATPQRSGVGRIAVVEHEVVAVWVREEGHVADAGVEGVAGELDALGLELGAGGGDVVAP